MYEEIKARIEQKTSERSHFHIERVAAADAEGERDRSVIAAHVSSELKLHMRDMYDDKDAAESAAKPHDAVREFGGLQTRRQWERHVVEQAVMDIGSRKQAFDFTVPTGSRVLAPPYDRDWSEGNGVSVFSRFDGKAYAIPKGNGFSAAGIGFYLTTNEPVLAAITPRGTYDWAYSAFADLPFVRSRGGMGITIYTNSEPQPTMSRQSVLWSVSGMTTWSGQKGSGQIADAASPTLGFGPIPLAPALVNMVPGSRYLVWVWCWQTSREDNGFWASVGFSMPFVTIDAAPPIFIR